LRTHLFSRRAVCSLPNLIEATAFTSAYIFIVYNVLAGHAKKLLSKRSPQWTTAPLTGGAAFNPASIAGFMGTLDAILVSLAPVNPKAPNSTVAESQPQPQSPQWPGSKRMKIRYGPYRIPPTSVRLNHKLFA
jgi:hypothetical protein